MIKHERYKTQHAFPPSRQEEHWVVVGSVEYALLVESTTYVLAGTSPMIQPLRGTSMISDMRVRHNNLRFLTTERLYSIIHS
ncbi:hypothetical protein Pmani_015886 [Petrolisthes manimaculis]|uniref:Uncharacterized protein n=1 Tax=Petrolisthes manimaculis TaxID=1843537 RepID=A0AAE1PRF4_9EUCA|nr:hypothetical protein Pmani_015886 [Petrolisthes manimaculis]